LTSSGLVQGRLSNHRDHLLFIRCAWLQECLSCNENASRAAYPRYSNPARIYITIHSPQDQPKPSQTTFAK